MRQGATVIADFIGAQAIHIGVADLDELHRILVKLFKVVRGVVQMPAPIKPEPAHVFLDRFDVLDIFSGGIGIVEPQVTDAAFMFSGHAEIETNRFGVADV